MSPTRRAMFVGALGFVPALLPALVDERLWVVWCAFLGGFAFVFALDAARCPLRRRLRIDVTAPPAVSIGGEAAIAVRVGCDRGRLDLRLLPELDPRLEGGGEILVAVASGRTARVQVPFRALRRGNAAIEALWLAWTGPLGLVRRTWRREVGANVLVTPDLPRVRSEAIRFLEREALSTGLKSVRFIGDGSEFEALREFQPGFDRRTMDWKASARHRMLLCREHRAERNHQVVLALDTGRLMTEPLDGMTRLDRAVHVALTLAIVAVKTGDRVGFLAFDAQPREWLEPTGGMTGYHRLQRKAAAIDAAPRETNFTLGLMELSSRLRRRALIVVVTEFVDTITAQLLIDNLARLARRHLILFVTFRDPLVESLVDAAPRSRLDLGRSVVAHDLKSERDLVLRKLRRLGVHCVDAPWQAVSATVINQYLEIKRRELVG